MGLLGKKKNEETAMTAPENPAPTGVTKFDASVLYAGMSEEEIDAIQGVTGLEEMPEQDRRIPLIVWNLEKDNNTGEILQKSKFYNIRSSMQFDQIICSLLGFSRIRDYTTQDEGSKVKTTICRSMDLKFGIRMSGDDIGHKFACDTCPFRKSEKIGEKKPCVEVFTVAAFNLEAKEIFVFRVKRSSHVPFNNYLEKNFFDKVEIKGKRRDLPLYMAVTRITLSPEDGSNNSVYYAPVFEMVQIHNDRAIIKELFQLADRVKRMKIVEIADSNERQPGDDDPNGPGF